MLGAVYGGRIAALTAMEENRQEQQPEEKTDIIKGDGCPVMTESSISAEAAGILKDSLGIFRSEEKLTKALAELSALYENESDPVMKKRLLLGRAVLLSASERRESRGAHTRTDYPDRNDREFRKTTVALYKDGNVVVSMRDIPVKRGQADEISDRDKEKKV